MTSSKPEVFATPAFLREVEKGTFRLFRSVEVEYTDPVTNAKRREKVRDIDISPYPLRELQRGEDERLVVLRSHHPTENRPLALVEIRD